MWLNRCLNSSSASQADSPRSRSRSRDASSCSEVVGLNAYSGAKFSVRSEPRRVAQLSIDQVPSSSSSDHGAPFAEIFRRYGGDFYLIDGKLFSPARVTFHNLTTGKSHTFGKLAAGILQKSFFGN